MVKLQNTDNTKSGKNVEQQTLSYIAGGNEKQYSYFQRKFDGFLQN